MLRVQRGAKPAGTDSERLARIEAKVDALFELINTAVQQEDVQEQEDGDGLEFGERDQTKPL